MGAPVVVLLSAALFVVFRAFERRDRSLTVVAIIWALILVEVAVYPNSNTVPPGIFHPGLGGLSFRLLDVVVPIAVIARISVHGLGRFGGNALLWVALLTWLATAGVIGALNGNSLDQLAFEGKVIAYLSAIYLTATIPADRYLSTRHITRLVGAAAILAALLLATDTAGVAIDLGAQSPDSADVVESAGEALDPAGVVGSDGASVFVTLGIVALALAFSSQSPRQRALLLIAAAPLLASTIAAGQRAAYLELAVAIVLLVALVVVSTRALRTTATELGLAAMIVAGAVLLPTVVSTALAEEAKPPPLEREVTSSFSGQVETLTTEGRVYQWRTAGELIEQRPVLGWGLGKEFEYFDPGFFEFFEIHVTHNIVLDLLLGAGVLGLLMFLAAIGTTAYRGLRAWLGLDDDLLAALALGTLAAIGGLLAKGMVESVFEKYRLVLVLALLTGMLVSVASAYEQSRRPAG
jgi:O-antigen ligase